MATSDVIDGDAVQRYRDRTTSQWDRYVTVLRAQHDAKVNWQISIMEEKYVEVPPSEEGKPATMLQRIAHKSPFRKRVMKATSDVVSSTKAVHKASIEYESECIDNDNKLDGELFEIAKLFEKDRLSHQSDQ